jgi:hypothetical protein
MFFNYLLQSKAIQYKPVPCHRQQHLLYKRRKIYYTVAYLVLLIDFPLCQSWYETRPLFHVQIVVAQRAHHSRGHDNMELLYATNTDTHHKNYVTWIINNNSLKGLLQSMTCFSSDQDPDNSFPLASVYIRNLCGLTCTM